MNVVAEEEACCMLEALHEVTHLWLSRASSTSGAYLGVSQSVGSETMATIQGSSMFDPFCTR